LLGSGGVEDQLRTADHLAGWSRYLLSSITDGLPVAPAVFCFCRRSLSSSCFVSGEFQHSVSLDLFRMRGSCHAYSSLVAFILRGLVGVVIDIIIVL
jgi:hypothetical protein